MQGQHPAPRVLSALLSCCLVGSLGDCSLPGQCLSAHCHWLSQLQLLQLGKCRAVRCELGGSLI